MRALVLGARGMLGRRVVERLAEAGHWVLGLDLPDLDIADPQSVAAALEQAPDWIVNCAAYTDVERAEDDPAAAFRANAEGPAVLARALSGLPTRLLHISTDYVYNGRKAGPYLENDPTDPLGVYARSKLAGEIALAGLGSRLCVVRTAWLYGPDGRHFFGAIIRRARETGRLAVVNDQHGAPTLTNDLAAALVGLIEHNAAGLFHATNSGSTTWYGAAQACCELLRLKVELTPISTAESGRKALRPANSVLCLDRLQAALGRPMRDWRDALAEYLEAHERGR